MNIAIDGPAGAGKSTIARLLAEKLNYLYIDTGAMYRALTLKAIDLGIDFNDDELLCEYLDNHSILLKNDDDIQRIYIDSEDVTDKIRSPEVSEHVSTVAAHENVRKKLAELQRKLAESASVVMDGRDIGTNILPNAELKIFLTASVEVRAKRRYEQLIADGYKAELNDLIAEISLRDKKDQERDFAPLKMADDAILIDTSSLSVVEVIDKMTTLVEEKRGED